MVLLHKIKIRSIFYMVFCVD